MTSNFTGQAPLPLAEYLDPKLSKRTSSYRSVAELIRAIGDDESDKYGRVSYEMAARNQLRHKLRHVLQLDI